MDLLKLPEFSDTTILTLENVSYRWNRGNISGTVCYLKNIGKEFPYFSNDVLNKTYDLREIIPKLGNNENLWLEFLKEIGYSIVENRILSHDDMPEYFKFSKFYFNEENISHY